MSYDPVFRLNNMGQANKPTPSATKTNTRTSTATAWDHEGVLVEGLPGEIMLDGGRREQNLLSYSEDFSNTTWTTSTTATVTEGVEDKDGGALAITVTATADNQVLRHSNPSGDFKQRTGQSSVWARRRAGSGDIKFHNSSNVPIGLNLTSEWQRFSVERDNAGTGAYFYIIKVATSGDAIDVCFPVAEDVTGRSNTAPSEYIDSETDHGHGVNGVKWYDSTNGNTVSSNVVTEAAGVALSPEPQILMQPARTNVVVNSFLSELGAGDPDVFANWSETANGTSTISQETADLPGGILTGCRFDIDGSGSLARISSSRRLSVGVGGIATISAQVKAANVSGLKFKIVADDGLGGSVEQLSADGTSWVAVDKFAPSDLPVSWGHWEFTLPPTNTGRTHVYISQILNNTGASVTHRFTALQLEEGVTATSPIKTTTAAVTRDNDLIAFADAPSWVPVTEGISILAITNTGLLAETGATKELFAGNGVRFVYRNNADAAVRTYDGSDDSATPINPDVDTEIVVCTIYSAALNKLVIGAYVDSLSAWVWDATPAAFSSMGTVGSELSVWHTLAEGVSARSTLIYNAMPPSTSTLADVQSWVEANAQSEITKWQDVENGGIFALIVQSLNQSQSLSSPTLTQANTIAPNPINQLQSMGSPVVTQHHVLLPQEMSQGQSSSEPVMTQAHIITAQAINQQSTLGGVSLAVAYSIVSQAMQQSQEVNQPNLSQHSQLTPVNVDQLQEVAPPIIGQISQVTVHGYSQAQDITSATLVQDYALLVDALLQSQEASQVTLDMSTTITTQGLKQLQDLQPPALTSHQVLAVGSLTQSQILEIIGLGGAVLGRVSGRLVLYTKISGNVTM